MPIRCNPSGGVIVSWPQSHVGQQRGRKTFTESSSRDAEALRSYSVLVLMNMGFLVGDMKVKCKNCSTQYSAEEMEMLDDATLNQIHEDKAPNCPVLRKVVEEYNGVLRLPNATTPPQRSYLPMRGGAHSYQYQQFPSTKNNSHYQNDIICDTYPGVFTGYGPSSYKAQPNYEKYHHRLESFGINWINRAKKNSRPDPELLAEAGLYEYTKERKDGAKCYSCGTVLFGWNDDEDVWTKHAQQSPNCSHVMEIKGQAFIDKSVSAQKPKRKPATKQDLLDLGLDPVWIRSVTEMGFSLDDLLLVALYKQQLEPEKPVIFSDIQETVNYLFRKEEAEQNFSKFESKWPVEEVPEPEVALPVITNVSKEDEVDLSKYEETQCKICFSSTADMLLRPCSHMVSCESCTKRLKNCPMCRKPIVGVTKVSF